MNKASQFAALYLRSSKDRSDVSIDAQRRELMALAAERNLQVLHEYVDVVESAKSEFRPAFQDLLRDLKAPGRQWSALLLLDTSRLSRRRYVAQVFKYEARKRGVDILYARLPQTDPITAVVLEAVFEAFDEVHSLMSREKGLAGMRENVSQGWRAGGRAPRGYQLRKVATGAVREGKPVEKSVLEPNEEAPLVGRYLRERAAGRPRAQILQELEVDWAASSLVAVEWNALTYAGHTIWNRHSETEPGGGYKGGQKMRPREEWVIQRNTHPAVISDEEAEALLQRLENSDIGKAVSQAKRGISKHMLSGLLVAPDGRMWEGWSDKYRLPKAGKAKGRYLPKDMIETAVVSQMIADFKSEWFVDALFDSARAAAPAEDPAADLRASLVDLNTQVARAMDLALQLADPAPALRKVDELEARRKALAAEITRIDRDRERDARLKAISRADIKLLVEGLATELAGTERPRLKGTLQAMVDRITLDPVSLDCRIHYRIPVADTVEMASPRRRAGCGALRLDSAALIRLAS